MVTDRQDDADTLPQHYSAALDHFGHLVRQIEPYQWGHRTPCRQWSVRALVNHVIVQQLWVPPLLAGTPAVALADREGTDALGPAPVLAWKRAATLAEEAVHTTGALDRTVVLWAGSASAAHLCSQIAMDTVVHAWDLACGLGAEERLPDPLVDFALRELSGYADRLPATGLFDPPLSAPHGADPQTRLLALTGRSAADSGQR
ncbi:TIGR03086 family metal-binding protein [Streptacidiphilus jiangxiensis]|uniref:TIGR03086 family protein n=1 Tax=Streptacidiphilus jiangxiensis TaxID=235985 RepID=A0A1H7NV03_STRJI|nr:TIGR03086 family metal-binding protein [Streptacidiphilus jiangxiensis]SEL27500.1 TIGR03086 family protein [Streptacidiphilus jiangxiensis]